MVGMRAERGVASLKVRAVVTQVMLGFFLLVTVLVTLSALYLAWREVQSGYGLYQFLEPVGAVYIGLAFVPAAIALSFWVWRGHRNLADDRLDGLRYDPVKASLALWIPVINLAMPKAAMRELWNRSHGEEEWHGQQSVDAINSWWTSYVIGIVVLALLTAMTLFDRFTYFDFLTPPGANMLALAFSAGLLALAAWQLLRIVGRVTVAQQTVTSVGDTFA
jgi:hypothetical protein